METKYCTFEPKDPNKKYLYLRQHFGTIEDPTQKNKLVLSRSINQLSFFIENENGDIVVIDVGALIKDAAAEMITLSDGTAPVKENPS